MKTLPTNEEEMNTEQLTPFERHELTQIDNGVMFSAIAATQVLVKSALESEAQLAHYRACLLDDDLDIDDATRDVTAQALRESRAVGKSIVSIANALEEKFNISA